LALTCRAVLFDLDGVLVDSTECVENTWRTWAHRHALDPENVLGRIHGRRAIDALRELAPELDADAERRSLVEHESSATAGLYPVPGASSLLQALEGSRWAVVTSGDRAIAAHRLRHVGLELPPVMVCAEDVREGKPDPEGYLRAASLLGVRAPDCVVIEDAPSGVAAALAAGMRSIAVATTHAPDALRQADVVIGSLEALGVQRRDDHIALLLLDENHLRGHQVRVISP
jgi:sugar-phosphatase